MSSELLDRLEARGYQKIVDETRLEHIKNIMDGLNYTAKQAMDLLKIPASEQPKLLEKIRQNRTRKKRHHDLCRLD